MARRGFGSTSCRRLRARPAGAVPCVPTRASRPIAGCLTSRPQSKERARSAESQGQFWTQAVSAVQESSTTTAGMLLLPALNQMIDITTTRTMATLLHPPLVVFFMLGALALVSALLAGYGMANGANAVGYTF